MQVAASKPTGTTETRGVSPPALPTRPRPQLSVSLGARAMRPVSAVDTAYRAAREERLRDLIARAKASGERARVASQRARELREAANVHRRPCTDAGSSSSSDDDEGAAENDKATQPQLKRRRPPIVSVPTATSGTVVKHGYRQATPR